MNDSNLICNYSFNAGKTPIIVFPLSLQFLLTIIVFLGNLLIILVIRLKKSLYENNTLRIVLSLSITDFILSTTVLPFTIYSQMNYPKWNLGYFPCALWLSYDLQLKTTSIFHLCSITYERYLCIAKPMLFRIKIKRRIIFLILFNWIASFVFVTLPFLILIFMKKDTIYKNNCFISSSFFIAYNTIITFWIPLVIMMFFGSRAVFLIRKLDKSHLKINSKMSSLADMTPRNSFIISESSKESRQSVQYLDTKQIEILRKNNFDKLNKNLKSKSRQRSNSLNLIYKRKKTNKAKSNLKNIPTINVFDTNGDIKGSSSENSKLLLPNIQIEYLNSPKSREESQISEDSNSFIKTSVVRRPSRLSTFRLSIFGNPIRKELKAQKTLTIALIVFLFSYFPFFTFLTIKSFNELLKKPKILNFTQDDKLMNTLFYSTTWLAYSSAAINPILQFLLNNNLKNSLKNTCTKIK